MITLEESVAFCELTKEEVLTIAEHEHIPEIAAFFQDAPGGATRTASLERLLVILRNRDTLKSM
jgi:hypothetical protein